MIQPAERGNDPLLDLAFDFGVFDDLQVLILAGFFYSGKHGASLKRHPINSAQRQYSQGLYALSVALPFYAQKMPPLMNTGTYGKK
jgi:hypothetical protein